MASLLNPSDCSKRPPAEALLDCKRVDCVQECPDGRGYRWDRFQGRYVARMCRRLSCSYCCAIRVKQIARAIARAKPNGLLTITRVGVDWPTSKANVDRVVTKLGKQGYSFEHAYTVEPHPWGGGLHAHLYVRGARVPEHVLAGVCADVGIGRQVNVRRVTHPGPKDYGMKLAREDATRDDHLLLNGRRLIHNSRKFFLDGDGTPCSLSVAIRSRRP